MVLVVPSSQKIKPSEKVPHKIYQVPYEPGFLEDVMIRLEFEGNKLQLLFKMGEVLPALCESALNSTELLEDLKGFDLMIYDSLASCAVLIGEHLSIPRVELFPAPPNAPFSFVHMTPMPISYVPQLLTGFTDKMTFVERVMNLGVYLGMKLFIQFAFERPMEALKVKYKIKPEQSYHEAAGDVELVIITADFAIEYSQPLLPGMKSLFERFDVTINTDNYLKRELFISDLITVRTFMILKLCNCAVVLYTKLVEFWEVKNGKFVICLHRVGQFSRTCLANSTCWFLLKIITKVKCCWHDIVIIFYRECHGWTTECEKSCKTPPP